MCVCCSYLCVCVCFTIRGPFLLRHWIPTKKLSQINISKGHFGGSIWVLAFPRLLHSKSGLTIHAAPRLVGGTVRPHTPSNCLLIPFNSFPRLCFDPSNSALRSPRFDEGSLCLVKPWKISWKYPEVWASMVDDSPGNSNDHLNL